MIFFLLFISSLTRQSTVSQKIPNFEVWTSLHSPWLVYSCQQWLFRWSLASEYAWYTILYSAKTFKSFSWNIDENSDTIDKNAKIYFLFGIKISNYLHTLLLGIELSIKLVSLYNKLELKPPNFICVDYKWQ